MGVAEVDFDGIILPKFNKKEIKKRMDDETEIIEKMKKLISQTDEVNTDITLHQQLETKDQVISDVHNHLFD